MSSLTFSKHGWIWRIFQNLIMRLASSFDGITIFSKNLEFNALKGSGSLMWLCCFFPKQSFCEMILERLLLLSTSIVQKLVMRLTMHVFLSFTANTTNYNKNKGKKIHEFFFSRTIQVKQRDVNICFEFLLSPFLSKSFFLKNVLF